MIAFSWLFGSGSSSVPFFILFRLLSTFYLFIVYMHLLELGYFLGPEEMKLFKIDFVLDRSSLLVAWITYGYIITKAEIVGIMKLNAWNSIELKTEVRNELIIF